MLPNVTNRSPNAARPLCEHILPSHPARGRIVAAAELVPKQRVTRANGCRVLSGAEPVRVRTRARNRREGLRAAGACVQAAHEAACIRARVRVRATPTKMSGDAGGADMGEANRGEQLRPLKVRCDSWCCAVHVLHINVPSDDRACLPHTDTHTRTHPLQPAVCSVHGMAAFDPGSCPQGHMCDCQLLGTQSTLQRR